MEENNQIQEFVEQTSPEAPEVPAVDENEAEVERRAQAIAQERNFKQLREQNAEYARRLQEAERRAYELEQRSKPANERVLADDDYIEARDLKKAREEQAKELEAVKMQLVEMSVKAECPDFYEVVTQENVDKLVKEHPELAQTLNQSRDERAKAIATYKVIKKFGLNDMESKTEAERIAANTKKPKVSNTVTKTESDLTRAAGFSRGMSDAEKKARYENMKRLANM